MCDNNEFPFVSAIIVARNESKYIQKSLTSLINQDYPSNNYEIIFVDGQSTDDTIEVVNKVFRLNDDTSNRVNYQILDNPKKILSAGWNKAIKNSKGKYVVRIDAHSYVGKDFISKSVEILNSTNDAVCVGGCMKSDAIDDKGKLISYVLSSPFGVGNSKFRYSNVAGYVDTVAFGLYRKETFNKVGYFDETLKRNQDIDFHSRIKKIGGRFYLDPSIEVTYYSRSDFRSMLNQAYGNGKWNFILFKRNPKALSIRHSVPLLFLSGLIGLFVLGAINPVFINIVMGILAFHLLVGLYFSSKKTKKNSEIIKMPFLFLSLHLAYGSGSLVGLFSHK